MRSFWLLSESLAQYFMKTRVSDRRSVDRTVLFGPLRQKRNPAKFVNLLRVLYSHIYTRQTDMFIQNDQRCSKRVPYLSIFVQLCHRRSNRGSFKSSSPSRCRTGKWWEAVWYRLRRRHRACSNLWKAYSMHCSSISYMLYILNKTGRQWSRTWHRTERN